MTPATATGVLVVVASEPSSHWNIVASRLLMEARTYSSACSRAYVSLYKAMTKQRLSKPAQQT